ncbi:MAG: hypothetical protein KJ063_15440 [Anaerolineae bacterium]|nr:hypothetical protein [Anaerolineae bacterium]
MNQALDERYLQLILDRIQVCRTYKPQFGQTLRSGLSLAEFMDLYRADSFYNWFGLDNPRMYAAHKAAGGITSIYRQLGIACEQLFRQIIQDHLGIEPQAAQWSYQVKTVSGRSRQLSLDSRIELNHIVNDKQRAMVEGWLREAAAFLGVHFEVAKVLRGAVFEVRQGYKSKDAKRQNADIANAAAAYAQGYLPVVVILSNQIDSTVAARYEHEQWLILRGILEGSAIQSSYQFCQQVIGFDLASFFHRHSKILRQEVDELLQLLLKPDG